MIILALFRLYNIIILLPHKKNAAMVLFKCESKYQDGFIVTEVQKGYKWNNIEFLQRGSK